MGEGVAAGVESLLADGRVHAVPNLSPTLQRSLQVETLRITHCAIKGDPRHDLRMGEMAAPTPYFPDSIVRLLPNPLQVLDQLLLLRPGRADRSEHVHARLVDGVDELPVDIELELIGGGVADAHRDGALVAGQPRHLPFDQLPLAGQAVHDLNLARAPGHAALQPRPPRLRFLDIARRHQCHQRQGRIAQPAIAVVPVAFAAELLRQRRRGRGDDPAGLRVGQRLQGQQGALHWLPPTTGIGATGGPAAPEPFRLPQSPLPVHRRRRRQVRRAVCQNERHALPFDNVEFCDRRKILALQRDWRP